jgi:hypothetical protein
MDSEMLSKIHKKFADEQQCKNERCHGYFLDKEPQDYCPMCRRKGWGTKEVEKDRDLVYREVDTTKLQSQVDDLKKVVEGLKGQLDKKKGFKTKKCPKCDREFTPLSPNQKLCQSCRDSLTK